MKYPTPENSSPAGVAAAADDVAALDALPAADLVATDASGNTPLVWAAVAGAEAAARRLVETGASLDARGYLGATAVNRAARGGHACVLKVLLDAGADPDVPNDKLQSPMHFAAFKKKPDCVELLLKAGASTYVLDRKGRTPAEDTSDEAIRATIIGSRG